jgi:HlyD family secretion protein
MFGRFNIAYEKHVNVLTIPAAALISEDSESVVYVVEDGAAVRRHVLTGISTGGRIEIIDGLADHEQIVITGQGSLRDGSKVLASISAKSSVAG